MFTSVECNLNSWKRHKSNNIKSNLPKVHTINTTNLYSYRKEYSIDLMKWQAAQNEQYKTNSRTICKASIKGSDLLRKAATLGVCDSKLNHLLIYE
jgi:hypothetical protein